MSEKKLQCSLIKAVSKTLLPKHPELALLYHIPNGELRDVRTAIALKRMGVLKGVPDLHLPVPRKGYAGLWLELKVETFETSPWQEAVHKMLRQYGHKVEVVRSVPQGLEILTDYLSD